jgi:predicted RNA binding protein YcfA (HicA-like mRNA interferase family)
LSRLPRITVAEVLRALQRAGFVLEHVRGSHHYLRPAGGGPRVTVAVHAGRVLLPKVLASVLEQAGMTPAELRRHL